MSVTRHKHKRTTLRLHKITRSTKPGDINRHITMAGGVHGVEYYYHATKGYRSKKL